MRILCLGLCLALAAPAAWGKTEDHEKTSSKDKSASKSKSKHESGSKKSKDKDKHKGKDSPKSKATSKHKHKHTGKHKDASPDADTDTDSDGDQGKRTDTDRDEASPTGEAVDTGKSTDKAAVQVPGQAPGADKAPDAGLAGKGKGKKSVQSMEPGQGFRGFPWGAPLSLFKDRDLREESGGLKYYTLRGDDMEVLGAHMREIVYVFCQDKLAGVLTRYDGQIAHLTLLGKLNDTWGTPLESPANVKGDRSWRYDAAGASIMMEYSESATTGALAWMAKDRLEACQQAAP